MSRYFWVLWGAVLGGWAIASPVAVLAQGIDLGAAVESSFIDPALPDSVKQAVLQAAAIQVGIPSDRLILERAKSKIWSDGCLGLGPPGQMCTAVLVQGWEVAVASGRQQWVYRTNASGQVVKFDPVGGRLSRQVMPAAEQIPRDQLPPKLDKSVVFREVKSGGFAGVTAEISLYKDGRLERKFQTGSGASGPAKGATGQGAMTRRISKKELKAFKNKLYQLHFGQFNGLRYPAPRGAADYFMVTLIHGQMIVQYADLNLENLPQDLQQIEQVWQTLLGTSN